MRLRGVARNLAILALAILTTLAGGAAQGGALKFTAPADWKARPTASTMRVAEYILPAAGGDTDETTVVVYYFGGQGGSVEANLDRWIGQMEQPDGKPSKAVAQRTSKTINGLKVTLLDLTGTYVAETAPGSGQRVNKPGYRLKTAVVETPEGPYFVKLTGPAKTVAQGEAGWEAFLQSMAVR
jgi:hypothetical protein